VGLLLCRALVQDDLQAVVEHVAVLEVRLLNQTLVVKPDHIIARGMSGLPPGSGDPTQKCGSRPASRLPFAPLQPEILPVAGPVSLRTPQRELAAIHDVTPVLAGFLRRWSGPHGPERKPRSH